jgi:NAD(P)-dependent dehydrogenase (short-subunit alcohol dehydrogenase family)
MSDYLEQPKEVKRIMFDLKGKSAIVTGGGTGIGELIAKAFVEAGASIVISGRRENILKEAAARMGGEKVLTVVADVTKRGDVDNLVEKASNKFGKIDILVNNAGINVVKPFLNMSEAEWDSVIDTSLKGCFNCCQAIGKGMVERKSGSVINITSVFGLVGFMNISPYITSRGGIVQFTKALAVEWGRDNVRVNAIAYSYMRAGLAFQNIEADERILKQNLRMIPMGRGGEPHEVPGVAVFLASDASTFVTGDTILVDGGWTAW